VGSGLADWGGIERYVSYLQQGLHARGHEVFVTCPLHSPLHEHTTHQIPIKVRGKHDLRALGAYLRLFRAERFDVVHVHFNPDFLIAGIAARLTRQPKTVLTRHVALPWSKAKVNLYSPLFDTIVPVSEAVCRQLEASGILRAKMIVAKAGCPALEARHPVELGPGFHLGVFGRLVPEKGLGVLFKALAATPAVKGHVFGSGPLEAELKAIAPKQVTFHGFVENVADYMGSMDVIAIPSQWEEAFPYAALEAMSLGKPVAASRVGGLPEIVTEGVTGVLFEKTDPGELAAKLTALVNDPERARAMGEQGRDLHRQQYTIEKMAERMEAAYVAGSSVEASAR
jgi:glycosyltransferase involved in cell wall biosynthesis